MMKRLLLMLAAAAFFAACSPSEVLEETPPQEKPEEKPEEPGDNPENPDDPGEDPGEDPGDDSEAAAARIEKLCEQLNGDLATLYTLIAADELPDCVVNVVPIAPAGETVGYGVSFKQNGAVTFYLDPNAMAAESVPQFGVYENGGVYCWAMNGRPLPSATGAPVPVVNDEGTVPRLKAEKGYWHISVDGGKSWWPAGLAPDGKSELAAMPLVSQVTEEAEAWSIVLADGETALSIPKEGTLHIEVDAEETLTFQPHEIRTVHYTVTGGGSKTVVTAELEEPDGSYTMQVTPTDAASGSVAITAQVLSAKNILVVATDGSRTATATVAVTLRPGIDGTTITVETPGTLAQLLAQFDQEAITELTVGGNLNSNDISTLKNLPNLAVLDLESANLETLPSMAFFEKTSLTSVKLPKNLKAIGDNAFSYCSGLTGDLIIPQGVTTIGAHAFYYCSGLTGDLIIPQGVTTIEGSAFSGCRGLTGELVIPQGVTTIEGSAFSGCRGLTGELVIPQGVTTIGANAFTGCSGLTGDLIIPQGVTTIGAHAFYNCSGLTGDLIIPQGVTSIEGFAFSGCSGLTGDLIIPQGVTTIGTWAFLDCRGLTAIYCQATVPPKAESNSFNYYTEKTLYVPVGTAEAYKAADVWKEFSNIVEMEF